jgi:hypothetical protein
VKSIAFTTSELGAMEGPDPQQDGVRAFSIDPGRVSRLLWTVALVTMVSILLTVLFCEKHSLTFLLFPAKVLWGE